MPEPSYWIVKVLIAVPGAIIVWKSLQAYRRRRTDPTIGPHPAADRWWRVLFLSGAVALTSLLLIFGLDAIGVPRTVLFGLLGVLFAATLAALVAAFAIGWVWHP